MIEHRFLCCQGEDVVLRNCKMKSEKCKEGADTAEPNRVNDGFRPPKADSTQPTDCTKYSQAWSSDLSNQMIGHNDIAA